MQLAGRGRDTSCIPSLSQFHFFSSGATFINSLLFFNVPDVQLMDENIFVDESLGKWSINLFALNLVNGEDRPIQASFGNVRVSKNY